MEKVEKKIMEKIKSRVNEVAVNAIDEIGMYLLNGNGWWQVGQTIDELVDEIEIDLISSNILNEDEDLTEIIDDSLSDVRKKIFDMLVEPVKQHFEDEGYDVEIDWHFEEFRVCEA